MSLTLWISGFALFFAVGQLSTAANSSEINTALTWFGICLVLAVALPIMVRLAKNEPQNIYRNIALVTSWLIIILLLMFVSVVLTKRFPG